MSATSKILKCLFLTLCFGFGYTNLSFCQQLEQKPCLVGLLSPQELFAEVASNKSLEHSDFSVLTRQNLIGEEPKPKKPSRRVRRPSIFDVNKPVKHINIKLNLAELSIRATNLIAEISLAKKQTLSLNLFFGKRTQENVEFDFWSFAPEYRRYIFKDSRGTFHGGYLGGYLRYRHEESQLNGKYNYFGLGGVVGRQWIMKDMFTIDLFGGAGYYVLTSEDKFQNRIEKSPGRGDIRFGVAFGICPE
jgi:hypothetical protein